MHTPTVLTSGRRNCRAIPIQGQPIYERSTKDHLYGNRRSPSISNLFLLPIIKAFTDAAGVQVETRDISLAGRILAAFPERLTDAQRIPDDLAELGRLTQDPGANIIKLPNISAWNPQMQAAIKEPQNQGYDLPDYPEEPGSMPNTTSKRVMTP